MSTPPLPEFALRQAAEAYRRRGLEGCALIPGLGASTFGSRVRIAIEKGLVTRADRRSLPPDTPMPSDEPQAAPEAVQRPSRDVEMESLRRQLREAQADSSMQEWARSIILETDKRAQACRPAIWTSEPQTGPRISAGIPTLLLSDLHWGEVVLANEVDGVNEYSTEIARRRLRRVIEKTCDLLRHHVVGDYPGIVLCLGGDLISGAIHDELEQTNDGTVMQQALDLFEHNLPRTRCARGRLV